MLLRLEPWVWRFLVRPLRAVDGDTFDAACDLGFGLTLGAGRPMRFRLVGSGGAWLDAPESRGPKASEAGKKAAARFAEMLAPLIEHGSLLAVETFKPDPRDAFGRWLAHPYALVNRAGEVWHFEPVEALVAEGLAVLGSRFP